MPYVDETELHAGAMGHVMWTWPWTFGIPTLQQITDALFPRPTQVLLPKWSSWVLDKWNQFADLFHTKFSELAGEEIESEEDYLAFISEAAEYAASEMEFDLWDATEGLPSMPVYEEPVEEPG